MSSVSDCFSSPLKPRMNQRGNFPRGPELQRPLEAKSSLCVSRLTVFKSILLKKTILKRVSELSLSDETVCQEMLQRPRCFLTDRRSLSPAGRGGNFPSLGAVCCFKKVSNTGESSADNWMSCFEK